MLYHYLSCSVLMVSQLTDAFLHHAMGLYLQPLILCAQYTNVSPSGAGSCLPIIFPAASSP